MAYLYKRSESNNWWLRIKSDDPAFRVNKSLGTPDKLTAEIIAGPEIDAHKRRLGEKPRIVTTSEWKSELPPGVHTVKGAQVFATERELFSLDGKRIGPNGGFARALVMPGKWTRNKFLQAHLADADDMIRRAEGRPEADEPSRPTKAVKTADDGIFEEYLTRGGKDHAGVDPSKVSECRAVWHLYKTLCVDASGKTIPLAKLTRKIVRETLIKHLQETKGKGGKEPKSATIKRKMTPLIAAVNFGVDEGLIELAVNPFAKTAPTKKDAKIRLPLSPDDIKAIKRNLHKLDESDRLLLRVVGLTGMRLGEPFQVNGETREYDDGGDEIGVRCVAMGSKTDASYRTIPLHSVIAAEVPRIKGQWFSLVEYKGQWKKAAKAASKRLNTFLHDTCGIKPDNPDKFLKDVHSLRHRAISKMENLPDGTPYSYRIHGHSQKGSHAKYVHKSWVDLRNWVDTERF